ncbi:hypothetical protein PanWU01x14_220540 [Parasponia andersonii]|uniref:Uncharacterized protein n=1 Tax=Parasponia andersonii TaxID=3476 RepID=A0A2P5BPT0_PARAD|nr:hypothetical protein PanWU01x14_220540 [Parasponia andersonii]
MTSSSSFAGASSSSPASSMVFFAQLLKTNPCSPFTTTLGNTISIKVDRMYYLIWCSQVISALRGHNLAGYVPGIKLYPLEFITSQNTDESTSKILNLEFEQWHHEDQFLLSWLLSSLSLAILS